MLVDGVILSWFSHLIANRGSARALSELAGASRSEFRPRARHSHRPISPSLSQAIGGVDGVDVVATSHFPVRFGTGCKRWERQLQIFSRYRLYPHAGIHQPSSELTRLTR